MRRSRELGSGRCEHDVSGPEIEMRKVQPMGVVKGQNEGPLEGKRALPKPILEVLHDEKVD